MPAVARIGDSVSCGDVLGHGSSNVFANNIAVCRTNTDNTFGHPYPTPLTFPPAPITTGSPSVFVNNIAVDRLGDPINVIIHGHPGVISSASPDVFADS